MKGTMIEKNDFAAFQVFYSNYTVGMVQPHISRQVFAQLEFQHKKRGTLFSKPAPDAKGYMNIALINALEYLESLRDK
jgi:hypothetical protein